MTPPLSEFLAQAQARIEARLTKLLESYDGHNTKLIEAMRYSSLSAGKRLRPALAYAAASAIGSIDEGTDDVTAALECIHVYSLIHDDLPAMDDDELRRGKPTCHIAFDEATAILAGDALQALAFQVLADSNSLGTEQKLQAISELARSSGASGMVLGQAIDLASVNAQPSLEYIEDMHRHKTGALIEASLVLGALSANADSKAIASLRSYAQAIGLAFQVQDDILDVTSDTETLGKKQGADMANNKPTYVSVLGLAGAQAKAHDLKDQAVDALTPFCDQKSHTLRQLADYIINRTF